MSLEGKDRPIKMLIFFNIFYYKKYYIKSFLPVIIDPNILMLAL